MIKIGDILKKYKIAVYTALPIIIVGAIFIILVNLSKTQTKIIKTSNYLLRYDKSWSLKEKSGDMITLHHGKEAKIDIQIIKLEEESKYVSIEDLVDEIIYNLEKQNENYKLISQKETSVSKYEFNGYKLLYENKESQVMVTLYKKSDKLIMFNYEAHNKYFDILLDSVQNIIYNFETKEKNFDLNNKITLNIKDVTYSVDEEFDKTLNKNIEYEIANNNYYVKYSIPSNFELSEFDSTRNSFNYKGLDNKNITISTNIYKYNVFEYLDKDNSINIYKNNRMYQNDKHYSDFKESLTKIDGMVDTYLYKNSYSYNKEMVEDKNLKKQKMKRQDENVILIYALNKNHILLIDMKGTGTAITKKLIDSIKIKEIKNYSSYVTSKKVKGNLVSEVKRYTNYEKNKIDKITINIPDKYKEFQKYNNIYSERYFGLDYNKDKEIYDYEIHYELTPTFAKIENKIENINLSFLKAYGVYNYLTHLENITLNNYNFSVYTGGYTQLGGIMFTNIDRFNYYTNKQVLFHELTNGGYLIIEISGNGKEITNDILNETTNFKIEEIDNKKKEEETI